MGPWSRQHTGQRAACTRDAECSEGRTCQADPTDPCNTEPSTKCFVAGSRICLPAGLTCGGPPTYRDAYRGDERKVAKGVLSDWCSVVKSCGSLSWVDRHSDVDGPAYYVEGATGCILEVCGGACTGEPTTGAASPVHRPSGPALPEASPTSARWGVMVAPWRDGIQSLDVSRIENIQCFECASRSQQRTRSPMATSVP